MRSYAILLITVGEMALLVTAGVMHIASPEHLLRVRNAQVAAGILTGLWLNPTRVRVLALTEISLGLIAPIGMATPSLLLVQLPILGLALTYAVVTIQARRSNLAVGCGCFSDDRVGDNASSMVPSLALALLASSGIVLHFASVEPASFEPLHAVAVPQAIACAVWIIAFTRTQIPVCVLTAGR